MSKEKDFLEAQMLYQKQIADLEAKLSESEKNVEFYQERYSDATTSAYGADLMAKNIQSRLEEEIRELQQQLAEKDIKEVELREEIARLNLIINENKKEISGIKNSCDYYMERSNNLVLKLAEKDEEIEIVKNMKADEMALKVIQKSNQDKISFCIEQLEKVKEEFISEVWDLYDTSDLLEQVCELRNEQIKFIDNQINELKEGK